jgi:DNA polymerase-3 subunit beta
LTVTIDTAPFAKAMKFAAQVVETRNTIPILSNVLVRISGGTLRLIASDLEMWIEQSLPCKGDMEFTAEASRLSAIAQAAGDTLILTLADRLTIKSGRSRWVLPVLPASDFPMMPVEGLCAPVEIANIAVPIGRVLPCISDSLVDASRGGIFLDNEDGKLRMVTLDKSRATVVTTATDWPQAETGIVPRKFARVLSGLTDGAVTLEWGDGKVRAFAGDTMLTGKLIDAPFPDYRRAIPASEGEAVSFDPEDMKMALRRVAIAEETKTRIVKLTASDGTLVAEIGSAAGEGRDEMAATGEFEAVGFNAQYLAEMLDSIGGDTVDMHVVGRVALFRRAVCDGSLGMLGTCLV